MQDLQSRWGYSDGPKWLPLCVVTMQVTQGRGRSWPLAEVGSYDRPWHQEAECARQRPGLSFGVNFFQPTKQVKQGTQRVEVKVF